MWEVQTAFERQNEIPFGILWLGKQLGFILDVGCASVCLDESKGCAGNHPSLVWTEGRECIKRTEESSLNPTFIQLIRICICLW